MHFRKRGSRECLQCCSYLHKFTSCSKGIQIRVCQELSYSAFDLTRQIGTHIGSVISLLLCCQAESNCRETTTTNCCRSFRPDKNECVQVYTLIATVMWTQYLAVKVRSEILLPLFYLLFNPWIDNFLIKHNHMLGGGRQVVKVSK